jgi:hypothetical protein
LQNIYFFYRRLAGLENQRGRCHAIVSVGITAEETTGGKPMSDNNEKILPVLRLLLVAFIGLLFVIALQLFLLVTGANAGITI